MSKEDVQSYAYHLVWLGKNLADDLNPQALTRLRDLDNNVQSFTDRDDCITYIKKCDTQKSKAHIIFVVSNISNEEIIPEIHERACISSIFILRSNPGRCRYVSFPKVRAISTDIQELLYKVQAYMDREKFAIDFSLFNNHSSSTAAEATDDEEKYPIRNLKEDQARFLWFSKCQQFMLELDQNDECAKAEMIAACRKACQNDKRAFATIDEFAKESCEDNAKYAIRWYTKESVIFRCINQALISGHIAAIYSYRYIIRLLCRQLKHLYETDRIMKSAKKLRLYRGQQLKLSQILLIRKHVNDLISLNSFISTTREEDVAKRFCFGRAIKGHEPVMLIIDIDLTGTQSTAFADVSQISPYPHEEEILLSIGSIFRIESVQLDEETGLYRVHLSLSSHDQLSVNRYIEETFAKEVDATDQSVLFGKLLFDMGQYPFAIEYLKSAIDRLSDRDDHYRATYLNNIGVCYNEIGKQDEALKHYQSASQMYKRTNNHQGLGACHHNMASYYYNQKDYETALQWALEAFEERHQFPLQKASTLDLLGRIQLAKHDMDAAGQQLRSALRIRLKYLGQTNPNHPDIGMSYRNLGRLDSKSSSLIDAQRNYSRAEEIFRHNYPPSHPLMIEITQCLEDIARRISH